jgi:hypothetical protein
MKFDEMTDTRPPGLERKACERCRKLKSRCGKGIPCAACAACAAQNVECIRLVRKRPVRDDSWCLVLRRNRRPGSNSIETRTSSTESALKFFFNKWSLEDVSVLDTFSLRQDSLLPDMNSMLRDLFSSLNRPRSNHWTLTDRCSLHQLFSTPTQYTLLRIDPLESHRQTIINHLSQSPTLPREDISWFTLGNLRHGLIAFFRHCHRHLPLIHLPSWDVATTPTSLVLVQALMGSVYLSSPSENALRARRMISDAFSLIFGSDEVGLFKVLLI